MKKNHKCKSKKEKNESSQFFEKIKEFEKAKKNLSRKSKSTSGMPNCVRFENIIYNFNERTIMHNKLIEAINIGMKLFTQEEACQFLGIKKFQYKKIANFPMFPIIRIGEKIKDDFYNYEKVQAFSMKAQHFQIYSKLKDKIEMKNKIKMKKEL